MAVLGAESAVGLALVGLKLVDGAAVALGVAAVAHGCHKIVDNKRFGLTVGVESRTHCRAAFSAAAVVNVVIVVGDFVEDIS